MENKFFRFKRLKAQTIRFAPILFIMIALLTLILGVSHHPRIVSVRTSVLDTTTPLVSFISAPVRWMHGLVDGIGDIVLVYRENGRLRLENASLQTWKNTASQLAFENQEIKKTARYLPVKEVASYTVRVLADNGGTFSKSKIVSGGVDDGFKKGYVAFTHNGLIGRIVETGKNFSRLLLVTDYLSRIPVMVGDKRIVCILSGDNTPYPKLILLPEGAEIKEGDSVVTSGDAGIYPSGLSVGRVDKIDSEGIWVALLETRPHFEFVRVVDFGLGQDILTSVPEDKK